MNKPIELIIDCPECGTKFDVSDLKRLIKHKIDAEMDAILDRL